MPAGRPAAAQVCGFCVKASFQKSVERVRQARGSAPAALVQAARLPLQALLQNSFHDFAKKSWATINEAGVNLKKLGTGLEFLMGGSGIENSAGSDYGDFGFCDNAAYQCR